MKEPRQYIVQIGGLTIHQVETLVVVIKHVDLQIDVGRYCIMGKWGNVYEYSRREGTVSL
jgi:hypothetical protein